MRASASCTTSSSCPTVVTFFRGAALLSNGSRELSAIFQRTVALFIFHSMLSYCRLDFGVRGFENVPAPCVPEFSRVS